MPTELNFRANIYGFKSLGVERIVSLSAVGSLKEELRRSTSSFRSILRPYSRAGLYLLR